VSGELVKSQNRFALVRTTRSLERLVARAPMGGVEQSVPRQSAIRTANMDLVSIQTNANVLVIGLERTALNALVGGRGQIAINLSAIRLVLMETAWPLINANALENLVVQPVLLAWMVGLVLLAKWVKVVLNAEEQGKCAAVRDASLESRLVMLVKEADRLHPTSSAASGVVEQELYAVTLDASLESKLVLPASTKDMFLPMFGVVLHALEQDKCAVTLDASLDNKLALLALERALCDLFY